MDLYPLDLVLAAALAWGMIFLGALPPRLLGLPIFTRQVLGMAVGWLAVAGCSPLEMVHVPILLGVVSFVAWRRLRREAGLDGKLWLAGTAGLGISLGVVLILAVTPRAYPAGLAVGREVLLLASLYLGGAVVGLAYALYVLTRTEATRAGVPVALVHKYAGWLWGLILCQGVVFLAMLGGRGFSAGAEGVLGLWVMLIPLGWVAWRRSRSPRPSTSGAVLVAIGVIGLGAEILGRIFAPEAFGS